MRKFFASAFGLTLTIALAVGVVLAWSGQATNVAPYTAQAGSISVSLAEVNSVNNTVYPTGSATKVLTGKIANNTGNPGVPVWISSGSVAVTNAGVAACDSFRVGGGITGSVTPTDQGYVNPGTQGGAWDAFLKMNTNAPEECQGQTLTYNVTINVNT